MANYCENILTITGDEEDCRKFKTQAASEIVADSYKTDISLEKFVPTLNGGMETSGYSNTGDWRADIWGVDRDVMGQLYVEDKEKLIYNFESASYPPLYWLEAVSKLFPDLDFVLEYEEPNNELAGKAHAKNGSMTNKEK